MLTPEEIVSKLKPCHYRYNDTLPLGSKIHYGFIAQDLLELFGDEYNFVTVDNNTGFYKVNYTEFIAILASVVKNQQQEINDLKLQVAALTQTN